MLIHASPVEVRGDTERELAGTTALRVIESSRQGCGSDNDTSLARGLARGQAEDFFVSQRDNFDALHREGEQTPKMMTVALHRRVAGKPARAAFARFVDHILRHDRVWICRRNEIAEHWRRQHPATDERG